MNFWHKRWFLALLALATAIPLLWPETPPMPDVPGHLGRYRVQLELADSPELQRYFEFHWMLVGNLGVDLLVQIFAPVAGLEATVKLIVLATPPITAVGVFWISKEIHGRVLPSALFALPFIYSFPFNYGFINYSLALALALNAFGLWLRMTRLGRVGARNLLFVPISCALWGAHAFGWGILGLLALSAELIRFHDNGRDWLTGFWQACLQVTPMGIPLAVMSLGHGQIVGGATGQFFDPVQKAYSLVATLRDRWLPWDSFGVAVAMLLIGAAFLDPRLGWSRRLAIPAAIFGFVFIVMPAKIMGLTYADLRLAPIILIIALVAVRTSEPRVNRTLTFLGLGFLTLRLAATTASFAIADRDQRAWLTALNHIPRGAPVLFLTGEYCGKRWELPRSAHFGSFVIARIRGFSNDQWQAVGAQLLRVDYPEAGAFRQDRSAFIHSEQCIRIAEHKAKNGALYDHRLESALATFPRDAFDYVWVIDAPGLDPAKARVGLPTVWRGDRAVLYRVEHQRK